MTKEIAEKYMQLKVAVHCMQIGGDSSFIVLSLPCSAAQKWGKHISGKRRCGTQSDRNCEDEGGEGHSRLLFRILHSPRDSRRL